MTQILALQELEAEQDPRVAICFSVWASTL